METLQSNFTTPEQSKRLLEMGVPADSADCYYQNALPEPKIIPSNRKYKEYINSRTGLNRGIWYFKPCWSVGRLIEIYNICKPDGLLVPDFRFGRYENMMHLTIDGYIYMQGRLDFSKLED